MISVPSTDTVTVAPGSPVPVIVGVLSLIVEPSAGAMITGGSGTSVSTVKVDEASGDTFPAGSVWMAVAVCSPPVSAVVVGPTSFRPS